MKENKHVKSFRSGHIKPSESILACSEGYIGEMMGSGDKKQFNGSLIVTNERVCFHRKGIIGEVFESIPIKSITSIERKSMMGHRVITLHTSHDDLSFKTFKKDEEIGVHEAIEKIRDQLSNTTSTEQNNSGDSFERLKKLMDLKESGIISQEEFESKKREIMKEI